MAEIRTDDQHPANAAREKLQPTGAALSGWPADVWGSGVSGCHRTGVFGTKEHE